VAFYSLIVHHLGTSGVRGAQQSLRHRSLEELGIASKPRIGWDRQNELGWVYDIPWGRGACLSKVILLASLTMYY
jgi:hypothetical protein